MSGNRPYETASMLAASTGEPAPSATAELRAWPKPGTRCEFAGCGQRAYALVADVDRAIYVCRECYDRRERER